MIDVSNVSDVRDICRLLQAADQSTDERSLAGVAAAYGRTSFQRAQLRWYPRDSMACGFLAAVTRDQVLVIAEGTANPTQALQYMSGAVLPFENAVRESVNGLFWKVAQRVYNEFQNDGLWYRRSVVLAGHSYGGGVATCLARIVQISRPGTPIQLVTFGAPRTGDTHFCRGIDRSSTWLRYMGPSDPVPFLPPHEDEVPTGVLRLTRQAARLTDEWDQGGLGIVIYPTGSTIRRKYPPSLPVQTDETVTEYLVTLSEAVASSHSFANYLKAVEALYRRVFTPQSELVPQPSKSVFASRDITTLLVKPSGASNAMSYVQMPKSAMPTRVRVGPSAYSIYWMGLPVFTNMAASSSRATLRKFIFFLRRFPSGTANSPGLLTALPLFISAAQAGGDGWSPDPWPVE